MALIFDSTAFEVKECRIGAHSVTYRAFEGIPYCECPADPVQKLNLYVPELYYHGEKRNGYDLNSAPIFMPNTVGGYMEGPAGEPGIEEFTGEPNAVFEALLHGYVVACAGVRGRNTGRAAEEFFVGGSVQTDREEGVLCGRAPALIVDMKAAIRYLRANADLIPGCTEHIITSGTSAGGALSAMTGAGGNSADYEPYLKAIGAADARDDIFAASCYCPIHNLEHADAAYEWLFSGEREFHTMDFIPTEHGIEFHPRSGFLTDRQAELSVLLKAQFPEYVNGLGLRDEDGNDLTLDADGEGSLKTYIKKQLLVSAQRELNRVKKQEPRPKKVEILFLPEAELAGLDCLTIEDGRVTDLDWDGFVRTITRMKGVPAFDALNLSSPENEEFGDEQVFARHFTAFSREHSEAEGELAEDALIKLLNPTRYIGEADTAKHWRIRHGAFDRDTSLAIPVILTALLRGHGCEVDFLLPWGLPHSGDYDLEELFAWIDRICAEHTKTKA